MLAILSDIHGNYPALQAVLEDMRKYPITDIICLGDICGYYAMVNECIDCLRSHNIVSLKGNHDCYLLGELQCERSKTVTKCIEFQKKVITKGNLDWLKTLHCQRETPIYAAVHGGWKDPIDEYILGDFDFTYVKRHIHRYIYFCQDTHIYLLFKQRIKIYIVIPVLLGNQEITMQEHHMQSMMVKKWKSIVLRIILMKYVKL